MLLFCAFSVSLHTTLLASAIFATFDRNHRETTGIRRKEHAAKSVEIKNFWTKCACSLCSFYFSLGFRSLRMRIGRVFFCFISTQQLRVHSKSTLNALSSILLSICISNFVKNKTRVSEKRSGKTKNWIAHFEMRPSFGLQHMQQQKLHIPWRAL